MLPKDIERTILSYVGAPPLRRKDAPGIEKLQAAKSFHAFLKTKLGAFIPDTYRAVVFNKANMLGRYTIEEMDDVPINRFFIYAYDQDEGSIVSTSRGPYAEPGARELIIVLDSSSNKLQRLLSIIDRSYDAEYREMEGETRVSIELAPSWFSSRNNSKAIMLLKALFQLLPPEFHFYLTDGDVTETYWMHFSDIMTEAEHSRWQSSLRLSWLKTVGSLVSR